MDKAATFNKILQGLNIPVSVKMVKGKYPEDKEKETTEWVTLQGAKFCAEKYQRPVLVTDTGIFIEALNGFPGVNTKFTLERIGNEGLIKLLEGVKNRKLSWVFSLGYCKPDKNPVAFTSRVEGNVPLAPKGSDGFGFDPIFVPRGHNVTFAEDIELRDRLGPFKDTIMQFARNY
jgi:XTP/dITP diphosphohydrolase